MWRYAQKRSKAERLAKVCHVSSPSTALQSPTPISLHKSTCSIMALCPKQSLGPVFAFAYDCWYLCRCSFLSYKCVSEYDSCIHLATSVACFKAWNAALIVQCSQSHRRNPLPRLKCFLTNPLMIFWVFMVFMLLWPLYCWYGTEQCLSCSSVHPWTRIPGYTNLMCTLHWNPTAHKIDMVYPPLKARFILCR